MWSLVIHVSQHWHRVPRKPRTEFPVIFTSRHLWTFSTIWKYKNYSQLLVCSLPSWTSSLSNCPLGISRSGAGVVLHTHKAQPPLHLQLSSNQASRSSHKESSQLVDWVKKWIKYEMDEWMSEYISEWVSAGIREQVNEQKSIIKERRLSGNQERAIWIQLVTVLTPSYISLTAFKSKAPTGIPDQKHFLAC